MADLILKVHLVSDSTFGRGDGVAGLVDAEIEHDTETGLPYLRGRQLKGLLVEECANILYTLKFANPQGHSEVQEAAQFLFGRGGSRVEDNARLHIGHALLPESLRLAVLQEIDCGTLTPTDILSSLTAIRRQTSVDRQTGAPEDKTLRSMRVLLRNIDLYADLTFEGVPNEADLALLGACAAAVRRAGTGRNRGRGRIALSLQDHQGNDATSQYVDNFSRWIGVTS